MQVLVVEDEYLVRKGTVEMVRDLQPQTLVEEAENLEQAFERLEASPATELILLDLNLPGSEGLDTLRELHSWCEDRELAARIVVLSALEDPELVQGAMEAHATGFIVKRVVSEKNFAEALSWPMMGKGVVAGGDSASHHDGADWLGSTDGQRALSRVFH